MYLNNINALLNCEKMKELHEKGVKIVFFPHARFRKYIKFFKLPSYIEIPNKPFQDILVESDGLITDFSSNTYEFAFMNKPAFVYIPDENYVRLNMKKYNIDNIKKYQHMTYCKT